MWPRSIPPHPERRPCQNRCRGILYGLIKLKNVKKNGRDVPSGCQGGGEVFSGILSFGIMGGAQAVMLR